MTEFDQDVLTAVAVEDGPAASEETFKAGPHLAFYVQPGGLVDCAIRELGAQVVAVDLLPEVA